MKNFKGSIMKNGRSPYAITPPRRGEDESSNHAIRKTPIFLIRKGIEIGHFIIRNFAWFRFPRSVTAKFF